MAKKRTTKKSSSTTTMLLLAGVGVAGYLFTRKSPRQKAIEIIVASGKVTDPAALQTMQDGFLSAWAYSLAAKTKKFPFLFIDNNNKVQLGIYITDTGKKSLTTILTNDASINTKLKWADTEMDATQKSQMVQMVNAERAIEGLAPIVIKA